MSHRLFNRLMLRHGRRILETSSLLILTVACAKREIRDRVEALRLSTAPSVMEDDLGAADLIASIDAQVKYFESPESARFSTLQFGQKTISKKDYRNALYYVSLAAKASTNPSETLLQQLKDNFEYYEVFGDPNWGDVFMTSYYEPMIPGSLTPTDRFSQPLYKAPDDMVEIQLSHFPGFQDSPRKTLIGRISKEKNANGQSIINPYFTRKEIDQDRSLKTQKLELVYVDPIDAFFLQIQGSGTIQIDDKTSLRVGYAAQNGQKYEAVGAFLRDLIPREKMSAQSIETVLRGLPKEKAQDLLNKNPSYVFFKSTEAAAVTYSGIPAFPGRTIATDTRYFPKGALAYLSFDKPSFATPNDIDPTQWTATHRFVFDHDKGGAINGPGRLDLFWGRGPSAKQASGVIKNKGRLYYLVPKDSFLERLPKPSNGDAPNGAPQEELQL